MSDTPLASVPAVGLSETVTIVTLIGSALTVLFGKDWGVVANAQHYAGLAVVLLPIGLGFARAIKHHAATTANAGVVEAQAYANAHQVSSMAEPTPDPYPVDPYPAVVPAIVPPIIIPEPRTP